MLLCNTPRGIRFRIIRRRIIPAAHARDVGAVFASGFARKAVATFGLGAIKRSVCALHKSRGGVVGDEFVIILEPLVSAEDAEVVAMKIVHVMEEPIEVDSGPVKASASIGVAL